MVNLGLTCPRLCGKWFRSLLISASVRQICVAIFYKVVPENMQKLSRM